MTDPRMPQVARAAVLVDAWVLDHVGVPALLGAVDTRAVVDRVQFRGRSLLDGPGRSATSTRHARDTVHHAHGAMKHTTRW